MRIPSAEETATSVLRAQDALAELRARHTAEEREAADQRAEQLTRWHAADQGAEKDAAEHLVEHHAVAVSIGGNEE